MHIDLTGKTALVTASTAGIGLAIAEGLARAGAQLFINGRSDASVKAALAHLRVTAPGAHAQGVVADLSDADGARRVIDAAPSADILVNNAGIYGPKPFFDIDDAEWEHFFQVNVMSGVRLARHYLKGMLERDWGRVVFISSESALNVPADMIHYGFTKTAQLSISRGLAKLAAGSRVTVNAVLPGPTMSDGVKAMLKATADAEHTSIEQAGVDFVRTHRSSSIIQRPATCDEVANLVVYVCSPQASATTGAALRVDGGVVDTIA
ncbi:D-beta-hydroxybutyrate dehydrogenase [Burkholderia pseudomallei]|uniref:Short-chain dehydrogenase n=4 Tax=Burkholderia pseudomallei TaxID=28450 RepID=Q63MD3_BURPS|nr:SDR family NAD(P)-dependent oxidoreductase [Burkholderia pseudomallei]KGW45339.1 short chain dehydrogenase family protein [Burkholderia pseudomallei MSHR684]KGX74837.1 short chain dehydrogenase family protein [Burkholderia pseudomallei MSHR435]ABN88242.1 3-hydroxybutyrate dehydrogenase [Burkholderia pseudomallei 668]AGR68323.1 short chain dehydrogenase family protein [Burkholderia pseudomallei MSHR305]AGZ32652.1 short chain dehydrogenase family protein [Burkholderia pseudomallei NCTC 13179]